MEEEADEPSPALLFYLSHCFSNGFQIEIMVEPLNTYLSLFFFFFHAAVGQEYLSASSIHLGGVASADE